MQSSQCLSLIKPPEPVDLRLPTSIDILFVPVLHAVSTMRRFVLALSERILEDADVSAEMALVTHELLENAVKYNIDSGTRLRVSVISANDPAGHVVVIRTRNRATPEHIHSAEQLIARVRDAVDPDLMYHQMILCSAEQSEGSGLGLARIRAETQMSIDVHVHGDEIEVVARAHVCSGGAK